MKVTILGARGSVPVSGAKYVRYGGATACVLLETASDIMILDAGSGILNLPQHIWKKHKKIHLFLSHFHMDHLMGIPMSPMMYDKDAEIIFYAADGDAYARSIGKKAGYGYFPALCGTGNCIRTFKRRLGCPDAWWKTL